MLLSERCHLWDMDIGLLSFSCQNEKDNGMMHAISHASWRISEIFSHQNDIIWT